MSRVRVRMTISMPPDYADLLREWAGEFDGNLSAAVRSLIDTHPRVTKSKLTLSRAATREVVRSS